MDLVKISLDSSWRLSIDMSPYLVSLLILPTLVYLVVIAIRARRYKIVKLSIKLGSIGNIEIQPTGEDVEIAHKIWTELVTRKAAISIDKDNDVVVEIYNSLYTLFGKIREHIAAVPATSIRNNRSTRLLVQTSVDILNQGLRPHLTKWHAKFRRWYEQAATKAPAKTPQEIQKQYKEYKALIGELTTVNSQLIEYAKELKKLIDG